MSIEEPSRRELEIESIIKAFKITAGAKESEIYPDAFINAAIEIADEANKSNLPQNLANWLRIYDEFSDWFFQISLIQHSRSFTYDTKLDRIMLSLIGNICSQLIAIRRLIFAGLDIQAKQLLRVLCEYIDIAILLSCNSDLVEKFEKTRDIEEANRFWHTYIARGKARKIIHSAWRKVLSEDAVKKLLIFEKQEDTILGCTMHPSLVASQMALLPRVGQVSDNNSIEVFGRITQNSLRTLSYAVYRMSGYIGPGYVPNIEIAKIRKDDRKSLKIILRKIDIGRQVLPEMIGYIFDDEKELSYLRPSVNYTGWFNEDSL